MFFQNLFRTPRLNPTSPPTFNLSITRKLFFSSRANPNSDDKNGRSLTASYLVSALGFSPESALAATRSLSDIDPEKAAKAIGAFEEQGFTQSQIAGIVSKIPRALSPTSLKTILPKIEFLISRGATSANVASIICRSPRILDRSLERHIVPSFEMLSDFLESDSQAIVTMTRCAGVWFLGTMSVFATNRRALAAAGVPDDNVRILLRRQPNCLLTARAKFDHALEKVKMIGVNPLKSRFVMSLSVIINLAESTWKKKVALFGRWGWSEEDTLRAFVKHPNCMMISEKKLTMMMEFFVDKMESKLIYIASNPQILSMSLKNRIIPRCTVIEALVSKKLIKAISLSTFLLLSDISFVKKFISPYSKEFPCLQNMYLEKLGR